MKCYLHCAGSNVSPDVAGSWCGGEYPVNVDSVPRQRHDSSPQPAADGCQPANPAQSGLSRDHVHRHLWRG